MPLLRINFSAEHAVDQSLQSTAAVQGMMRHKTQLKQRSGLGHIASETLRCHAHHLSAERVFRTNHFMRFIIRSRAPVDGILISTSRAVWQSRSSSIFNDSKPNENKTKTNSLFVQPVEEQSLLETWYR